MYYKQSKDSYERVLAIEFDGKSVLDVMKSRKGWELQEVIALITAEGGYVENGIVHRGKAVHKITGKFGTLLDNDVELHDELIDCGIIKDKRILPKKNTEKKSGFAKEFAPTNYGEQFKGKSVFDMMIALNLSFKEARKLLADEGVFVMGNIIL